MTLAAALTTPSQHPSLPSKSNAPAPAPSPLAPLTPQQIQQQAKTTVSSSYAPSYQNLNQQQKQANNIASKREADNKYYLTWLDTQGQALQAHADAANTTLDNLEQQLTGQQTQQFAALPGQLIGAAGARAGNVSNEANANAFGRYLSPQLQANEQDLHGAAAGALAATGNTTSLLGAARANAAGFVEAGRDKQMADLNTALTNIAQERSKLQSSETGDVAKEIARLQGVEISKAEYNQNYATAAQKLGITVANTQSEIASRQAAAKATQQRLGIEAQNSNIALSREQNAQMNSDRNYNLAKAKYDSATAKDIYERQHHLGAYKVHANAPLSTSSQNTIYNRISTVQGELRQLMSTYGYTSQQAYHQLMNGSTEQLSTKDPKTGKTIYYNKKTYTPPDVQILNAAYNLTTGFGLTKGDIAALEKMGLVNPGSRLKVADQTSKTGGSISRTGSGSTGSL